MMFTRRRYDFTQEKVAHRPASSQKLMTFADGIVVAVAENGVDYPFLASKSVFVSLRPNAAVDKHVDLNEFVKALMRRHSGARLRHFRTFPRGAVLRIAPAEQGISHR